MRSARRALGILFGLSLSVWLHASPFAYVTHQNGVSVVDLGFRGVLVELPGNADKGVAVRPDLNRAYAAERDKITVIDTRPQAAVATAGYPTVGGLITMRPGRPEAYVITDHCSNAPGSACTTDLSTVIRIFNTDTNSLGDSFADNATSRIAFSGDGELMFITRTAPSSLAILTASTRQTIATIALASGPGGMAVDTARNLLYVAESGGTVAVVNLATRAVASRIPVGSGAAELAIAGDRLFVTNSGSNSVSVIDLATRAVIGTVGVGVRPVGIDVTPDGDEVVVANNGSNNVTVIGSVSLNVSATIAVGPGPQAIGRFIVGGSAPQMPDTLTGLWWNPAQPGWGVHVSQRGGKLFAAWFTYNANGAVKWYISSDCVFNGPAPQPAFRNEVSCTGNVYETTGPRFFSDAYNPGAVTVNKLGLFQMVFQNNDTGSMSVVVGTASTTMPLKRQVFRTSGPTAPADYTDLWWNPSESGWGIGITQQFGTMFLAWFAYDDAGGSAWYVASDCAMNTSGNGCTGNLYRTSGPIDPLHNAFDSSKVKVTQVGTITATFSNANSGTLTYIVDGKAGTKSITRQVF